MSVGVVALIRLLTAALLSSVVSALGPTFGTGLAGVSVCQSPLTLVNRTLLPGETHGVLHHFWVTGAQYKVDRMWVEYFIDGEPVPSISFQPSFMCGLAFPTQVAHDFEFSAGGLCGKTAPVGGWSNVFPVPFYRSVIVTVRGDPQDGCFDAYLNVRGTIGLPLSVPGTGQSLPNGTRMILQTQPLALRQPLEFINVMSFPAGMQGQVFQVSWAVEAQPVGGPQAGGGYIEGCWNFYAEAQTPYPGLIAGTGVEDYFDSGFYFGADSGDPIGIPFFSALAGLPLFERVAPYERLSAYRFHNTDPLVFTDGGALTWQVGSQGSPGFFKCGNPKSVHRDFDDTSLGRTLSPVNVTTSAWTFVFSFTPPPPPPPGSSGCADATCDAFCDIDGISGCVASWNSTPSLRSPSTGAACGGSLGVCASPADACAKGWSVCLSNATTGLATFRSRMSSAQCAVNSGHTPLRFVSAMSHAVEPCPPSPVTTDNGCAASGYGAEPICCGSGCVVPSCPNSVWQNATRIHIDEANGCGALNASTISGVLCCRDENKYV